MTEKYQIECKMKRLYLIIFIVLFISTAVHGQQKLTMASFNCENAFDTVHDYGKNDVEYVRGGSRNWSYGRLYKKLDGIAKVIAAVDTVNPVGVVALCEVENDSVLKYLTRKTVLRALDYDYVMTESDDVRGIDVALLYSKYAFKPVDIESLRTPGIDSATRDILHVSGLVATGDTLDVYAVHLPSKLGGKKGLRKSMTVAEFLKVKVDSVLAIRQKGRVVIMGDFNAEFQSPQFSKALRVGKYWQKNTAEHQYDRLYDVTIGKVPKGLGTYKYKGVWSVIDHILVCGSVDVDDSGVQNSSYLLESDERYGGVKPRRTYVGFRYNGGISDHLPVWMRINLKK